MKNLFYFLILLGLSSCQEEILPQGYCVFDEGGNTEWLDQKIKEMKRSQSGLDYDVSTAKLDGVNVIIIGWDCDSCADMGSTVYDCQGNVLCIIGGIAGSTCDGELTDIKLIWKK